MKANYLGILAISMLLLSGKCQTESLEEDTSAIIIIEQTDEPYRNGYAHGSQLKMEVSLQINQWEKGITSELNITRDSMLAIIYEHSGFLNSIKANTPDLLQEIYGIADGAQLDRDLVLAYNLGEEIYNFCTANFERCSNIAYSKNGEHHLAYNQDLPHFLHGNNQIIVLQHEEYAVFTMPGFIGLSGVGSEIAVSCNSLPMLRMNKDGLPLSFFIRQIFELNNPDRAKDWINHTPMAIGQNLMMLSRKGIMNVELSLNQIQWTEEESDGFYRHTNFPLENTDYKNQAYTTPVCKRYAYFQNIEDDTEKESNFLRRICTEEPITNDETFLRFIAKYSQNEVVIELINPISNANWNTSY